jgi:hypothetical protein
MIFQYTLSVVLNRSKTQTRRIMKSDDVVVRALDNQIQSVTHKGRTKWEVGKTYSVQPRRGAKAVARIRLKKIRSENVSRISTADALAEGFKSRQAFLTTWRQIHGDDALDVRVWVLEFELVSNAVGASD